jgi:hypothetical protein
MGECEGETKPPLDGNDSEDTITMTPGEIMQGMKEKNRLLSLKNDEYVELVEKRALLERAYNVSLAAATVKLKTDGHSITLIKTLANGDKVVSDYKFKLDVAHGVERACLESIKNLRGAIDTYRSLLAWLKAEMTAQ